MARSFTLVQLRLMLQRRGQWENSEDITPDIINDAINEGVAELWDMMIERWADYYTLSTTLATTPNVATVPLSALAPFYKLRKIEIAVSGRQEKLLPHDLDASHTFRTLNGKRYRYRLQGPSSASTAADGVIVLVPTPTVAENLTIYYIPSAPLLVDDTDALNGFNGYEELVVQLALRTLRDRQDMDLSAVNARIEQLSQRIRSAADNRDAGEPFYLDPRGPTPDVWEDDEWA